MTIWKLVFVFPKPWHLGNPCSSPLHTGIRVSRCTEVRWRPRCFEAHRWLSSGWWLSPLLSGSSPGSQSRHTSRLSAVFFGPGAFCVVLYSLRCLWLLSGYLILPSNKYRDYFPDYQLGRWATCLMFKFFNNTIKTDIIKEGSFLESRSWMFNISERVNLRRVETRNIDGHWEYDGGWLLSGYSRQGLEISQLQGIGRLLDHLRSHF